MAFLTMNAVQFGCDWLKDPSYCILNFLSLSFAILFNLLHACLFRVFLSKETIILTFHSETCVTNSTIADRPNQFPAGTGQTSSLAFSSYTSVSKSTKNSSFIILNASLPSYNALVANISSKFRKPEKDSGEGMTPVY